MMTEENLKFIIVRVLDNANDTLEELKDNPKDAFYEGKKLAYYEVLDTIKNELSVVEDIDLADFGLDISLDKIFA